MESIFSPGLDQVIAGETAISTLDHGLSYRGYSIEDLGQYATFEEVAYLILYGELPTNAALSAFQQRLADHARLPQPIVATLAAIPREASMMDVMRTGASLLAHWDPETESNDPAACRRKAERILAQMPVVLGARERLRNGQEPTPYDSSRSFAANVLGLLTGRSPSEQHAKAMDTTLIMYAEHEFNASTFTARVVVSTMSDLHAAITAAIGTLKGPLHGGANERVMEVLNAVGAPDRAEGWIRDALARKARVMGFGHRVYKDGDPRAAYLKSICAELAASVGRQDLEQTAEVIEQVMRTEKGIPPNLDWPSARIYHYLGLPVDVYTPLFVVSRVTGWAAHVIEQLGNNRLIRPRSRYIGSAPRPWVPRDQR